MRAHPPATASCCTRTSERARLRDEHALAWRLQRRKVEDRRDPMPVRHTSWATPMRYHALFEGLRASLASVHVSARSTTPPTRRARPKSDAGF